MPTVIRQSYPPKELDEYIHQEPIMILFIKPNSQKYVDKLNIIDKTCTYSGQLNHRTFDKMILDDRLRKIIVLNERESYSIKGEVTEIMQIRERVCKNVKNKIDPVAPMYQIKYKDLYDINYDIDRAPYDGYLKSYLRRREFFHHYHLSIVDTPGQNIKAIQHGIMLVRKEPPAEESDAESAAA